MRYYLNIGEEAVFFLIARGGIGKTTLLAKFMLDHAMNQSRQFPFVYLDFDRATLHTREPRQLLFEAARQVSLQFPEVEAELAELTAGLHEEMAAGRSSSITFFDRFRHVVQKLTRGSRAFLIVFDTMEVVQYDPASLAAVINFVTYLNGFTAAGAFPELRIVASGRADVPELRTEQDLRSDRNRLILQPLSWSDAGLMARNVGRDFIGDEWQAHWESLVAGNPSDPPERREPLVIRVAIELIRSCKPEDRERLVQSIAKDGENASDGFVGLLYERRILEHVQEEEVRKLAWPGLVARRVTRNIIATTLAPICDLDPDKVDQVFKALANEVWMVEEEDNGEVLRHRTDLRSRTLPLMRKRDPEKFDNVNSAVRQYYESRQLTPKARAEWLYHRLLGGEHPDRVDRDWTDDMAMLLAGAADDFAADSEARAYVMGRTAEALLPPQSVQKLSPRLALDHVARTGAQLGSFDDTRIEPIVLSLSQRIANPQIASSYPHPVKAVLLAKTGQWNVPASFEGGTSEWRAHAEFARLFKRARDAGELQDESTETIDDRLPLRTLVQELAAARIARSPRESLLDRMVTNRLREATGYVQPSDFATLRTAVVFGWQSSVPAARAWFGLQDLPTAPKAVSLAEIAALMDINRSQRRAMRSSLEPRLKNLSISWSDLAANARTKTPKVARIGNPDFRLAVLDQAQKLLGGDNPDNIHVLRRFFAARNDDWIVPLGYAAARVLGVPSEIVDLFKQLVREAYLPTRPEPGFRRPDDALQLFRWADEGANLNRTATAVLDLASGPEAADLRQMRLHLQRWREQIDELLNRNEAEGADAPPSPGEVVHPDDLQKGRWGGRPERNGRRLEAKIGEVDRESFDVDLTVLSTDGSLLEGPVLFHLHDSFPRKTIYIRRIREGSSAVLEEVNAYGTFTVGAQVKTADGRWTGLELDLVNLQGLPRRFIGR
ncbi:pYEATS domain-containing protein [Bradyrhizobium paxllaeri]|uniref:pYEATS domain-containing protein n=1 Tax=Bradyrhizobium paxllaeri TaxID=190148 RepID=UPI0011466C32|nr:pYEATS domain-containing protein [Bradyrhizobium paxllaeri]